jgi:hypothetical protein
LGTGVFSTKEALSGDKDKDKHKEVDDFVLEQCFYMPFIPEVKLRHDQLIVI